MFQQMYYNDFKDKQTQNGKIDGNSEQLLKNGKRFAELFDAVTRNNGNRCGVPLSFKQKVTENPK